MLARVRQLRSFGMRRAHGRRPHQRLRRTSAARQHVIGVVSGKGGVGKSLVTSLLASEMNKRGNKVGILDADITGPSIERPSASPTR